MNKERLHPVQCFIAGLLCEALRDHRDLVCIREFRNMGNAQFDVELGSKMVLRVQVQMLREEAEEIKR